MADKALAEARHTGTTLSETRSVTFGTLGSALGNVGERMSAKPKDLEVMSAVEPHRPTAHSQASMHRS
ncbi:hypothetical protein GGR33_004232 [Methylobacterium brachythecii]|uniref:Uncharacterized protein n=1 Tax=Methylobacterium brachythecii TaxID=1176177 RepID=A0A7W6ANV3_9HYPH|nr:hypothetical protein [Methylobacterium brachythecii]